MKPLTRIVAAAALAACTIVAACDSTPGTPGPGPDFNPGPGSDLNPGPGSDFDPGPAGAERISGSGNLVTVEVDIDDFDSIELAAEGSVVVTIGDGPSLSVTADDNLHDYLEVDVRSGTLRLATVPGAIDIDPTESVMWTVTAPDLSAVNISGAGSIRVLNWAAERIDLRISGVGDIVLDYLEATHLAADVGGVGDITASGTCQSLELLVDGIGTIDTTALIAASAVVSISNGGSVSLTATDSLDVDGTGFGTVAVHGSPTITGDVSRVTDLDA